MSSSAKKKKPTEPELFGIDVSAQPTNQETVVLNYVTGSFTAGAHFLTPAHNQRTVPAPSGSRGKK